MTGIIALWAVLALPVAQIPINKVQSLVSQRDIAGLKTLGPSVLPLMAQLYTSSDQAQRANIAEMFYHLSWKSPEARQVLMQDVHTPNENLRLQVQWALGRVSGDLDVVDVLLSNMRNDANPLFRDKAACALAYDQVHLTEKQKVRLYEGLIQSLSDPKLDVRQIALLALSIQTGQTKNFDANAPAAQRETSIQEWKRWLQEYRSRW
jgi:HEAT repeat protein